MFVFTSAYLYVSVYVLMWETNAEKEKVLANGVLFYSKPKVNFIANF